MTPAAPSGHEQCEPQLLAPLYAPGSAAAVPKPPKTVEVLPDYSISYHLAIEVFFY